MEICSLGSTIFSHADNPLILSHPGTIHLTFEDIRSLAHDLGIPLPLSKVCPFDSSVIYLGFIWHFDLKTVEIPREKKEKELSRIKDVLSDCKLSLDSLRSLTGFLAHLALVVLPGRARLRSLYTMQSRMQTINRSKLSIRMLLDQAVADLTWWRKELQKNYAGLKLCTERFPNDSLRVFVDASTDWGIGVVIARKFDRFRLVEGWKVGELGARDIGWAEFVAVELAVYFLISFFNIHNIHILIHSDNNGVVLAWRKRSSRNAEQNAVLLRVLHLLSSRSCFLTLEYVRSADNPADPPSCGFDPPYSQVTTLPSQRLLYRTLLYAPA